MAVPVHITTQQPVKSTKESDQENKIRELESVINNLNEKIENQNYVDSLIDEKIFRLYLLSNINKISKSIDTLNELLIKLTSNQEAQQQ